MNPDALRRTGNLSEAIATAEVPVIPPEKQFIQLALQVDAPMLLPVLNLVEILTVGTSEVVPMFQLPPWVVGVYNLRGDILWVVDLNHLMGFSPWYQQKNYLSNHTVLVVKSQFSKAQADTKAPILGLVVNRVQDMATCEPDHIQPLSEAEVSEAIEPFLKGYWVNDEGQVYWILDGEAILSAMPKA